MLRYQFQKPKLLLWLFAPSALPLGLLVIVDCLSILSCNKVLWKQLVWVFLVQITGRSCRADKLTPIWSVEIELWEGVLFVKQEPWYGTLHWSWESAIVEEQEMWYVHSICACSIILKPIQQCSILGVRLLPSVKKSFFYNKLIAHSTRAGLGQAE